MQVTDRIAIPRRRLVNFRLTDAEYEQLRKMSLAKGRGISEFARSTILEVGCHADGAGWLNERLNAIEVVMSRLLQALNTTAANTVAISIDQTTTDK